MHPLAFRVFHLAALTALCAAGALAGPQDWTLSGGTGRYDPDHRLLSITGSGTDSSAWTKPARWLRPGARYRVTFDTRCQPGSSNWTILSGLGCINKDVGAFSDWRQNGYVFHTPDNLSNAALHFGQWHLAGTALIKDIRFTPVDPVYRRCGAMALGEGESVSGAHYAFRAPLSGAGLNDARPLTSCTAGFNSDRFVFQQSESVVYRHSLPGVRQTRARVELAINYYKGGECVVSVSRDGVSWREAGRFSAEGRHAVDLPEGMFPADAVWVRLSCVASTEAGSIFDGGAFQVNAYRYETTLDQPVPAATGATTYLGIERRSSNLVATVEDIGSLGTKPTGTLRLRLRSRTATTAAVSLDLSQAGRKTDSFCVAPVHLRPGAAAAVSLPYRLGWAGPVHVRLTVTPAGKPDAYVATAEAFRPYFLADDYGYRLPAVPSGGLWWCESTYKVPQDRGLPAARGSAIRLSAARREREAVQLVLAPRRDSGPIRVTVSDLAGPKGARIPASAWTVREVTYVRVKTPTDTSTIAGQYPDPLPPLTTAWHPQPGRNNPLWLTVKVPANARAGDYGGTVTLRASEWTRSVPVRLHVWNYALPEHSRLRSGFGLSAASIRRYHNLKSEAAMAKVWDLYMRDFAEHRLAPYDPMSLAPYQVRLGNRDGKPTNEVQIDFTAFDSAARRYLDGLGFNAFVLPFQGLPSGRGTNVNSGQFLGEPAGTPRYDALMRQYGAQIEDHLKRRGWLKKAYVYWYDEPEVADYPMVVDGMARLRRYAPGLTRMLTEEFSAPLIGAVDLWCPISPNYDAAGARARQQAGEEVWWYVCTWPRDPWATEFIDHPAIDLRLWLWQTWQYRIQGILIWETAWWNSPTRNPGDTVQNPWEDAQSYSVETPAGSDDAPWGNGDGRFFYPPSRDPNANRDREWVTGPVDSIRWEMLADGVEDWDSFDTLAQLVKRWEAQGRRPSAVAAAKRLLVIPPGISSSPTVFTHDPQRLYRYRAAVARAIEALQ